MLQDMNLLFDMNKIHKKYSFPLHDNIVYRG
jgi:hypothetical protein